VRETEAMRSWRSPKIGSASIRIWKIIAEPASRTHHSSLFTHPNAPREVVQVGQGIAGKSGSELLF
jgi:hypothetical protein